MRRLTLLGVLLAGIAAGFGLARYASVRRAVAADKAEEKATTDLRARLAGLPDTSEAFQLAAKLAAPSVVCIRTEGARFRIFGDIEIGPPQQGQGSGVIVDAEGHILTNAHVLKGAKRAFVTLNDQREFQASLVGFDQVSDIAVLKIEAEGLRPAALGDSRLVELGQWAMALGNPYGLGPSVSVGIISAVGRDSEHSVDREGFLQTDAAINPGNSGGALVNIRGEVIGITNAIVTSSRGNEGIAFAIPIARAQAILKRILEKGSIRRGGYVGVRTADLVPQLAAYYDMTLPELLETLKVKEAKGAFVVEVIKGSPAQKAGIVTDDLILEIAGRPVANSRELRDQIALIELDSTVPVKVRRRGADRTLQVKVGELP
ncbi:MAG: trypsin-like peptidase domain-containing protein [Planctomycetes bacterium]|nr:trypsin-like peptidase domain-containing protein [Planctomycetota bacterium]